MAKPALESALVAAGFLRQRCSEPLTLICPICGATLLGLSIADSANGVECPAGCKASPQPLVKCSRCNESLPSLITDGERECLSIQAYRKGDCKAAFASNEALWCYKKKVADVEIIAAESDLRQRFASGDLDADVLVRSAIQDDFIKAGACPEFRDVAKPRPAPEPPTHPRRRRQTSILSTVTPTVLLSAPTPPPAPPPSIATIPTPTTPATPLSSAATPSKPNGEKWVLILLIVVFWPAAIWYGVTREFSRSPLPIAPSAPRSAGPGMGIATASLILGITSLVLCGYGFPFAIAAIVLSRKTRRQVKAGLVSATALSRARAGQVMAWVSLVASLVIYLVLAIAAWKNVVAFNQQSNLQGEVVVREFDEALKKGDTLLARVKADAIHDKLRRTASQDKVAIYEIDQLLIKGDTFLAKAKADAIHDESLRSEALRKIRAKG